MIAIERELGWLEHETELETDILQLVHDVLGRRYDLQEPEASVVSQLTVLCVSQLSRWLIHSKPPEIDAEAFIRAAGRMLRALLPERPSTLPSRRAPAPRRSCATRRGHAEPTITIRWSQTGTWTWPDDQGAGPPLLGGLT